MNVLDGKKIGFFFSMFRFIYNLCIATLRRKNRELEIEQKKSLNLLHKTIPQSGFETKIK